MMVMNIDKTISEVDLYQIILIVMVMNITTIYEDDLYQMILIMMVINTFLPNDQAVFFRERPAVSWCGVGDFLHHHRHHHHHWHHHHHPPPHHHQHWN